MIMKTKNEHCKLERLCKIYTPPYNDHEIPCNLGDDKYCSHDTRNEIGSEERTSNLTKTDYGTLGLALGKCQLLNGIISDGKFKLCVISQEHIKEAAQKGYITMVIPFGFPEMSDEEVSELMQKLQDGQSIAWLKEQRDNK
jgi:hypothetical protein